MESVKIKSNWNFRLLPEHMESNFGKSQTQPNDVLSVEEIIRRSSNGIPLGNMRVGDYLDDDIDLPDDYDRMDKLERIQFARDQAEQLEQMKADYEESRKKPAGKADDSKESTVGTKGAQASDPANSGAKERDGSGETTGGTADQAAK